MDWTLFILALFGILAHSLSKLADAGTQRKKFNWKKNLVYNLYALIVIGVLIFIKEEFTAGFEVSKATAFFIGYFSDSLIKNFSKFNPFEKAD